VEVVVRPKASALKVNKKIEAEWRGLEYKDEDEFVPAAEKLERR